MVTKSVMQVTHVNLEMVHNITISANIDQLLVYIVSNVHNLICGYRVFDLIVLVLMQKPVWITVKQADYRYTQPINAVTSIAQYYTKYDI